MREIVDRLLVEHRLSREEYLRLITDITPELQRYIATLACQTTLRQFGTGIYARGLIELTNYCRNNCYYCGLRRSNREVERYRLTKEEVLECCAIGGQLGIRTFVLQGGEDPAMGEDDIVDLIRTIRRSYPDNAITLSLGERSAATYRRFLEAGANRYLLRHETANAEHYRKLHPPAMSFEHRLNSLRTLKEMGFQTGAGMMTGSPGQTAAHLVEDILFIEELRPQMIGIGPFIPQHATPFAGEQAGSVSTALLLVSILRLMFPNALIPSTTALATLSGDGYSQGILAGANVIMPNLTPLLYRGKYAIYDNKKSAKESAADEYNEINKTLNKIGRHLSKERGDYKPLDKYV